ncbi:MAG: hypothetical protein GX811_10585, partial [Lentisphaerae bacterium]|nr:hypothetical protein [Lentisphaerota bacterium]
GLGFRVNAGIDNLQFVVREDAVGLDKPVKLVLEGVTGDQLLIEKLDLSSSFLIGRAQGSLQKFKADLSADLGEAARELGKFMDMTGHSFAGKLNVTTDISEAGKNISSCKITGNLEDISLTGFVEAHVKLPNIKLNAQAGINFTEQGALRDLTDLSLGLTSELANIHLAGQRFVPGDPSEALLENLKISLDSDTARLLNFVSNIVEVPAGTVVSGPIVLKGETSITKGLLQISQMNLNVNKFKLTTGKGLLVDRGVSASGNLQMPLKLSHDERSMVAGIVAAMNFKVGHIRHFGVDISEVNVPAKVQNSKVNMQVTSRANEGTVNVPVTLDMQVKPPLIIIPDNTLVLDSFKLNDDMLNELLGLALPILQGCAVTAGNISFMINKCSVPLVTKAGTMDMENTVVFKSVALAPAGPVREILEFLQLPLHSITIPNQELVTRFVNGRFVSSPITFHVGSHPITLSGSVGLDQTLEYTAMVPFTRELVGDKLYKYLAGQSAPLTISGNVNKPRIDKQKLLADAAKIAASAAASEKGQELLNKGVQEGLKLLDGIFKK